MELELDSSEKEFIAILGDSKILMSLYLMTKSTADTVETLLEFHAMERGINLSEQTRAVSERVKNLVKKLHSEEGLHEDVGLGAIVAFLRAAEILLGTLGKKYADILSDKYGDLDEAIG